MKLDSGTIARTVCMVIALVNQILTLSGITTIALEDDTIYAVISGLFTIGTVLWNWWKNNNITQEAKIGQSVTNALKKGEVTEEAVKQVVSREG